jgi:glycosyltransferase involved in cell wall biosynthesis
VRIKNNTNIFYLNMSKNKKKIAKAKRELPFVSLCTPTFNRRPFIPFMIKCFLHQTYPKDRIEWIIIDDGTDPISDLVQNIPQVKYFYVDEKMELGKKRNFMHSKTTGDILIYMDDDDYYPPERISHAVEMLQLNPRCLIAGSSEMHIYFDSKDRIYQCGPYGPNHATAATFAFRRELLNQTQYDEDSACAEENAFLKKYTIPMVQLDTLKTILVCSHQHNSLNKEKLLLENPKQTKTIPSRFVVDDFVKDAELKQFYTRDMNQLLQSYQEGKPENKPKVFEHLKKLEKEREKRMEAFQLQQKIASMYNANNANNADAFNINIKSIKESYELKLEQKNTLIQELFKKVKTLGEEKKQLENRLNEINASASDMNAIEDKHNTIKCFKCQKEFEANYSWHWYCQECYESVVKNVMPNILI